MRQNPPGSREPLPDSSTVCPFGKHRGDPIEVLLNDIKYVGWMCRQEGMVEDVCKRYPLFGAVLVNAVGSGAPALSKEEKAFRQEEMKRQSEEKRAQRAAKQVERERLMSPEDRLCRQIDTSRQQFQQLYQVAKKVTTTQLQVATPGQRYFHEIVVEALERSIGILDASQSVLNEAAEAVQALWKNLPPPSEWWFRQKPVLLVPKPEPGTAESGSDRKIRTEFSGFDSPP